MPRRSKGDARCVFLTLRTPRVRPCSAAHLELGGHDSLLSLPGTRTLFAPASSASRDACAFLDLCSCSVNYCLDLAHASPFDSRAVVCKLEPSWCLFAYTRYACVRLMNCDASAGDCWAFPYRDERGARRILGLLPPAATVPHMLHVRMGISTRRWALYVGNSSHHKAFLGQETLVSHLFSPRQAGACL